MPSSATDTQEGSYGIEGESSSPSCSSSSTGGHGANPWQQLPPAKTPREFSGMVAWKRDNLVIVGGSACDGQKRCLGSVEVFNFSSRTWTVLEATLHQPRRHCAVAIVGDRFLYVMGGNSNCDRSFVDIETVECLDLLHPKEFIVLAQCLPFPIRNAVAIPWKSRIFIIGGYSSSHETVNATKKEKQQSTDALPGYCRNLWVWDTKTHQCMKLQTLAQPRWLPAVSIVRSDLVVAGGYNGRRWLNDVETYPVLHSQWEEMNCKSVIPSIPSASPRIRAFWTRMNQLTLLCDNVMHIWDWGSTKWRTEKVMNGGVENDGPAWTDDDLSVPRSALSANCVVCLDSNRDIWEFDRPSYNAASIDQLNAELRQCEKDVQLAAEVGFWELAALDKAASAHLRIPKLKAMLKKLDTIQWLQKQKDSLIQGFVMSQSAGAWDDCKQLSLDIRDVEEDLEEAHRHLCELENGHCLSNEKTPKPETKQEVTGAHCSPLRRKRSVLMQISKGQSPRILTNSFRRGDQSTDDDSLPTMEKSYDGSGAFEISSVGEFDLSTTMIIEDLPFQTNPQQADPSRRSPQLRRQSSLLLQSLLSTRDLKELARSSQQQSVDAVFM